MRSIPRPWTKYFLGYWMVAAVALYISWAVFREHFFSVMGFYLASVFAAVIIVVFREQRNFMKYLKDKHLKKWEEISTFPFLGGGPGGRNSLRALGFVYGKENLNDPVVECLKRNFKNILPWALFVPISHVGLMLFLVFVGVLHKV